MKILPSSNSKISALLDRVLSRQRDKGFKGCIANGVTVLPNRRNRDEKSIDGSQGRHRLDLRLACVGGAF